MKNKTMFITKEAAQYLGISISTIYRMEKQRLISSTKTPGGQRRFNKRNLDRYLKKSQSFEAPQNPSKYKASLIKDSGSIYTVENRDTRKIFIPEFHKVDAENKPYFQKDSMEIYNDDILTTEHIKEGTVDLIVTSPPYNVGIEYSQHNDKTSYNDYLLFTEKWLKKCLNLLKDDGRFCLNIPLDKNKGGQQSVCADITTIAKQVGWKYHSTIIWNEQNISRRTAWGSWLSARAPYVIAPVEVIVIFYKKFWRKTSGSGKSDISKKEFMEWTNGVWNFAGESKKRIGHPAPFPVELPKRCIKLFTFIEDIVLDPFLGSGSTLIASALSNRKGIGVEIDKDYCELAKERLIKEAEINQQKLFSTTK